ncbi:peptidylprolyl isomerase [bacterium]|nr:peptidylprolyl isomerase [bacterium]
MREFLAVLLLFLIFAAFVGTPVPTTATPEGSSAEEESTLPDEPPPPEEKDPVVVVETSMGNFEIQLLPNIAPKTCENFLKLVRKGFYDGLTFHRVIDGFIIQGGDPKGDGTGGPGYTIPAEFSKEKHLEGTVAMARLPDQVNPKKESSGSQFYICLAPAPHLDGEYTIFGRVVSGMDVVHKIGKVKTGKGNRPLKPVIMERLYLKRDIEPVERKAEPQEK